MTMILEGRDSIDTFAIIVYVISVLTNMMLYFIADFVFWQTTELLIVA